MNLASQSGKLFLCDKPVGPTSFDIVRKFKKIFPGEKIGHAGTLDPFASGLLVVLVGKATRCSETLMNAKKVYRASLFLGELTDSLDLTGKIIEKAPVPSLTSEDIKGCLKSFLGEWLQEPPMFSAKKVGGVPLYRLARKQITVERTKKPVHIYEIELIEYNDKKIIFEVCCSKGTYVRSLGKEIAERLGTLGHLTQLRRLASGEFSVQEALSFLNGEQSQQFSEQELVRAEERFFAVNEKRQLPTSRISAISTHNH